MSSANLGGAPSRALHGSAHCGASAVESLPETADEIAENASAHPAPDPSLPLPQGFSALPGYAPRTAPRTHALSTALPGYASLIRAAQVAFRARQHRKKAVRIIEAAWSEWRFHSKQAQLAAHAVEGAPYHAYHAERRERAARIIQGYLQRGLDEAAAAEAAGGAHDGVDAEERGDAQYGAGANGAARSGRSERRSEHHLALPVYNAHEVHLLRTVQRAFRAHLSTQRAEAEEVSMRPCRNGEPRDAEHASAHHGAMLPFPQVLDATMRVQVERQNGDEQEEDSFGERDQRYGPLMSNP